MYNKILSPIDGSETSNRGITEAIRLAKDQKARLRFLHVVDAFLAKDRPQHINILELIAALRRDGEQLLDQAKARARAEGVDADSVIADDKGGRIAECIVEEAGSWLASVIVMGTHGRRGVSNLFMGSDAEAVVRTSPVPVLLVRNAV